MKRAACLLMAVFLFLSAGSLAPAAAKPRSRTVRVAYPVQQGLTNIDEYGNYSGYSYEYLQEIAQYTGWDYEFVQVEGTADERLIKLMDMLEKGEIDLMGDLTYSEDMAKRFDYASHSYGVSETVLQVPYDSVLENAINSQIQQTLTVAAPRKSKRSKAELEDYCVMNLLTPKYVYCDSVEEQLEAVREGRAQVMLNTSFNYVEGVRTIAKFAPKPMYFIMTKGADPSMMEALNDAIVSIEQADPTFANALYEKYFAPPHETLTLTDEEKAYIESAGTLKVGVMTNNPPFQYDSGGAFKGITVDLLAYITEKTGLNFEIIPYDSPQEVYDQAGRGTVQIVAGMPYSYNLASEQHLSMSRPYISSSYILLMHQKGDENTIKGKRLAIIHSSSYKGLFLGKAVYFDTMDDCIRAVENGDADYTYVDSYTAQYYINMPQFSNLKMIPQTYQASKTCFGIVKSDDTRLLSILNRTISTISEVDMQAIINQNTIQKQPFSLENLLRGYPVESVTIIVCVMLLIIACLLLLLRQRVRRNKETSLELKKHFRVYALVNEYFMEYDFRKNTLIVSVPPTEENEQPKLLTYDANKPQATAASQQRLDGFLAIVKSRKDGLYEEYLYCIDGKMHWLRLALETVYDQQEPMYILGKINIIDEEKQEKDQLIQKAQLDSLTHILNAETSRSRVMESLASLTEGHHGALLLIDIDYFKTVNDTYGHRQGDQALAWVAQILRESVRQSDVVGRPGGDEFILYAAEMADVSTLEDLCQRLCATIQEHSRDSGAPFTISVGAALSHAGDEYGRLYERADQALYKAKENGRNRYTINT